MMFQTKAGMMRQPKACMMKKSKIVEELLIDDMVDMKKGLLQNVRMTSCDSPL